MTNNDEMAIDREFDKWFKSEFHPDITGPYVKNQLFFAWKSAREAMLAERDADKAENIKLRQRVAELEAKNALVAGGISATSKLYDRIAELEARTVHVKFPAVPRQHETLKLCLEPSDGYGMQKGAEYMRDEIIKVLAAVGINLEVGE